MKVDGCDFTSPSSQGTEGLRLLTGRGPWDSIENPVYMTSFYFEVSIKIFNVTEHLQKGEKLVKVRA